MFVKRLPTTASTSAERIRRAQHDYIVRGSGFVSVLGSVGALALLAFYPPTAQVGAVGWAIALPGALFSLLLGALYPGAPDSPSPERRLRDLAHRNGPDRAPAVPVGEWPRPFIQLLLLPALGAPASQSPRRCAQVLLTIGAVGASPLLG
jgi:hypothetical protein